MILQHPTQNFHVRILHSRGQQYNRPPTSEIDEDGVTIGGNCDIIFHKTNDYLQRIDKFCICNYNI